MQCQLSVAQYKGRKNHALPFRICDSKHSVDLRDRERTLAVFRAFANTVDEFARVVDDVPVALRLSKQRFDRLEIVVCRRRRSLLCHLISEFDQCRPCNGGKIELRRGPQEL